MNFESSLREVIKREDEKENLKIQNSSFFKENSTTALMNKSPAELSFLSIPPNTGFIISTETDASDPIDSDGNNVSLEKEMMDEAKNGM